MEIAEQIEKIMEYIRRTKASYYPIKHDLARESEGTKDDYLTMLCLVMQYSLPLSEGQIMFFQRLISGSGASHPVQEYLERGQNVDEVDFVDFIERTLVDDDLRYAFAFDALLISCLGVYGDGQVLFLAELMECLRMSLQDAEHLSVVCADVLEQNYAKLLIDSDTFNADFFIHYFTDMGEVQKEVSDKAIAVASAAPRRADLTDFYRESWSGYELELPTGAYCFCDRDRVYLHHLKIDLRAHHLIFDHNRMVEIVDCEFTGGAQPIWFFHCDDVIIRNCTFSGFSSKTLRLYRGNKQMEISDTSFTDCIEVYSRSLEDWREQGCVIYGSPEISLTLERGKFINCGGWNRQNCWASSIISNCNTTVRNSHFENCWHYHTNNANQSEKDPKDSRRVLFRHVSQEEGNELLDAAPVGPSA